MNFRLLSKVGGLLLLLLSVAMFICLDFAYFTAERGLGSSGVQPFGISTAITLIGGVILLLLGRKSGLVVLRKEGIAIVGLGWMMCGVFGALPYLFGQPRLGIAEAFFESISGFTTTGATVIVDLDQYPRSILLWRSLTQWLGGLGILVLFVALLSTLGVGSKALFRHESSGKSGEGLQSSIHDVAARLWQIYVLLSALCCAGLYVLGMSFYDALTHTFAAISTGGFSPRNESVAAYGNVWIELWIVLFMACGGVNFMLYAWILRRRWERWAKEEETRFYLWTLGIITVVICLDIWYMGKYASIGAAFRVSLFQVVSIMTTTGFVTANFDTWPPFSKLLLVIIMFVGGCAGSTAGGIKVSRWLLFVKIIRAEIIAAFRPTQVISLHLNGNLVTDSLKSQTVFFVALAGFFVLAGSALMSFLEPTLSILSSVTAVVASLFNVGPGLEAVGPAHNYAELSPGTLVFLSFLMVLGRLEFFAVLVLFVPSLWRKY